MDDRYAAGLIDGEGCILISRQVFDRYVRYQLRVVMRMTNPAPLIAMQKEYGGSLSLGSAPKDPRHRRTLAWTIVSRDAANLLRRIRPYLLVKGEEADIALEFQDGIPIGQRLGKGNRELPASEWARRERLHDAIIEAKHRPLDPASLGMAANSGKGQSGQPRAKQTHKNASGVCND